MQDPFGQERGIFDFATIETNLIALKQQIEDGTHLKDRK